MHLVEDHRPHQQVGALDPDHDGGDVVGGLVGREGRRSEEESLSFR